MMKIDEAVKQDIETRDNIEKSQGGRPPADEQMKSWSYAMKPSDYERIKRDVEADGDKMSVFVRRAIFAAHRQLRGRR